MLCAPRPALRLHRPPRITRAGATNAYERRQAADNPRWSFGNKCLDGVKGEGGEKEDEQNLPMFTSDGTARAYSGPISAVQRAQMKDIALKMIPTMTKNPGKPFRGWQLGKEIQICEFVVECFFFHVLSSIMQRAVIDAPRGWPASRPAVWHLQQ